MWIFRNSFKLSGCKKRKITQKKYVDGASAEWNKTFKMGAHASQSNSKSNLKTKRSAWGLLVKVS